MSTYKERLANRTTNPTAMRFVRDTGWAACSRLVRLPEPTARSFSEGVFGGVTHPVTRFGPQACGRLEAESPLITQDTRP